jgi:hypothetical protein
MRITWNIELLNAQNFKMVHNYSNEKLSYRKVIEGYCKTENCENTFQKSFKNIVQGTGPFCLKCLSKKTERTPVMMYDFDLLQSLDFEFTKKYDKDSTLFGNTVIEGLCKTENCTNTFEKHFKFLITAGPYCKECTQLNKRKKITQTCSLTTKWNMKTLEKMDTILLQDYSGIKLSETTVIEGICKTNDCNDTFKKSFRVIIENGGPHCESCTKQNLRKKMKMTSLKKYGVENPFQSDIVKDKIKNTNIERYGFEKASQHNDVIEKMKNTNLERYGFEFCSQNDTVKQKMKETNLEKYGVESVLQCEAIYDKYIKSCYSYKDYVFPSGNIVKIQGYENLALDILLQDNISENDIKIGYKDVPIVWYEYEYENTKRRYYTDIFIPSQNKCIEVKSDFTFYKEEQKNVAKQSATKSLGYLCEIWIFNNKEKLIQVII